MSAWTIRAYAIAVIRMLPALVGVTWGYAMPGIDRDRLNAMDVRLRAVEGAVIELATMARMLRIAVGVMLASLGLDISELI